MTESTREQTTEPDRAVTELTAILLDAGLPMDKAEARAKEAADMIRDCSSLGYGHQCGICGKLPCDYHGHYPVPMGEV